MITGYFGLPGCGKTTMAAKKARQINKKIKRDKIRVKYGLKRKCPYDYVFTNFPCKDCYVVDFSDLGRKNLQRACLIFDEITKDADNRDFKHFKKSSVEGFILHRHYFLDIFYYTQNWNAVDKKIRDLTHSLFYVRKSMLPGLSQFSRARRIFRDITINEYTKEIVTGYRFPNIFELILDILGIIRIGEICFRPFYYKDFDSFEQPLELEEFELIKW